VKSKPVSCSDNSIVDSSCDNIISLIHSAEIHTTPAVQLMTYRRRYISVSLLMTVTFKHSQYGFTDELVLTLQSVTPTLHYT